MTRDNPGRLTRRGVVAFGAAALGARVLAAKQAAAQGASDGPIAPIRQLNDALLAVMKAGQQTPFLQRFNQLAPVIDQAFDLQQILAESIGLSWPNLAPNEKSDLLAAFRRYTVSSYTANFDSYSGQRLEVSSNVRQLSNGEQIVGTSIVPVNGSSNTLDYVMRSVGGTWKVVDVLADGSISRVAVQRSDFRQLLESGGVPALVAGLRSKVANLSGGMLA